MKKKSAMSALGYAICIIIIAGIGMIISAPMMANKYKEDRGLKEDIPQENYTPAGFSQDVLSQMQNAEARINSRIDSIESRLANSSVSNKYVCTISGNLDENGVIVPLDSTAKKFVFVCEYRQ